MDPTGDRHYRNPNTRLIEVGAFTANMITTDANGNAPPPLTPNGNGVFGQGSTSGLQAGPFYPGEYTVQFHVEPPNDGDGYLCLATITWKIKGMPLKRVITVGPGIAITGVAEAVDVKLQDMSFLAGGIGGARPTGQTYTVTITVSKGSRPTTMLPPVLWRGRGIDVFAIPPLSAHEFLVPEDSGVISYLLGTVDDT